MDAADAHVAAALERQDKRVLILASQIANGSMCHSSCQARQERLQLRQMQFGWALHGQLEDRYDRFHARSLSCHFIKPPKDSWQGMPTTMTAKVVGWCSLVITSLPLPTRLPKIETCRHRHQTPNESVNICVFAQQVQLTRLGAFRFQLGPS